MCLYAPQPTERANVQLLLPYDPEQTAEVQGEDKYLPSPTCDCAECQEERREKHEARQEQARARCEADFDPARTRRLRIYRWRRKHGFPLFFRCREERELLRARRQERMQVT